MTALKQMIAVGSLSQPWVSFSALTQSNDGITWDPPIQPFQIGDDCSSVASDGTSVIVADYSNNVAVTTNLVNFVYINLQSMFGCKSIINANNNWILVGTQIYPYGYNQYPANSEVSQIYLSAGSAMNWQLIWSNSNSFSRFYKVRYFTSAPITSSTDLQPVIIACGYSGSNATVMYSLDYGETWTNAAVPSQIPSIYSVGLFLGNTVPLYIWGCNGRIFQSTSLQDSSNWTEILVNSNDTIVDISITAANVVAMNGINNIYTSFDGENFNTWSYPGYVFNRIAYIEQSPHNRWVAFARSLLTQYSMWTSTDLVNWYPINNNVHTISSTLTI